ncbi:hypothetical protein RIF29_41498 [Crotalaria pallida]|uniref:Receptor-like serine/threonine-protein kinase n=1 Tax=Crotalaria pallida TaxID=3830 RepID=A0AAN9E556_CROPI
MMNISHGLCSLLILMHLFSFCLSSYSDIITTDTPLSDGELVVSNDQSFALGFFSPDKSTKRYVGIWYFNLQVQTVVWVANRDDPINDTSGVLSVTPQGSLELRSNLILTQKNNTNSSGDIMIWQGFDHLTDTYLPYTKLGYDKKTYQSWYFQSWKAEDDPGTGSFKLNFSYSGALPEIFIYKDGHKYWRAGSYNGEIFPGIPFYSLGSSTSKVNFVNNGSHVDLSYYSLNKSVIFRAVVLPTGIIQVPVWNYQQVKWNPYWSAPSEQCDYYGYCGANSNCEIFRCSCLPGFELKNKQNMSEGCVRKNNGRAICGDGEGFIKIENAKIPDLSNATENADLQLEECRVGCLTNCTCTAYAAANVSNGGSGCLAWNGDLMDIKVLSSNMGQDLYVRVDAVTLANYGKKSKKTVKIISISIASIIATALLIAFCLYCIRKRKAIERSTWAHYMSQDIPPEEECDQEEYAENTAHPNLPFFNYETLAAATFNFGGENELGKGGFGSVYKGILGNGQEIAVKRLSKHSGQGTQEFKNEINLIARLQHRNLVRLLGYSVHKEERMLIYEYLPNKSLDFFIFDKTRSATLNWDKRFEIIFGIARGILYLHQDSRLKIIHRDLKASNILLDDAMNPKISDFGMAKLFGEDQTQAITRKVVGTYGYMSPEYAILGRYSIKSDVFSFGVLLLEIITGKRNIYYGEGNASLSLIGQVWNLWREERALDIVDSTLGQSFPPAVVLRCIHIGILCVQERTNERPSMSEVVFMLGNETNLPSPQKPAHLFNNDNDFGELIHSVNEASATIITGR